MPRVKLSNSIVNDSMDDNTLINGLLAKRTELLSVNADLRERMAVVSNDIDAVERVLDSLGYQGEAVTTPRAARIVLFYRNELREYLLAELRKAPGPMTARELAVKLCEVEGKDWQDRRLITDVVRRVGCALRRLRATRVVEGERSGAGQVWRVTCRTN